MNGPVASLDIIVPMLDEEGSIDEFHRRVAALGLAGSLLFVDNASRDGTVARIERLGARLIRHPVNLGYGASIRDGLAAAKADRVIVIDADLEYPPEAIPALVAALDRQAVVYASRFLAGSPPGMPALRRLGNRLVSATFNLLFRQRTTDLYTGMKGLRRDALAGLRLERNGFEHVVELAARLAAAGHRIHEVPVEYAPRSRGASKMRHLPEMLKFGWFLLLLRLRSAFTSAR